MSTGRAWAGMRYSPAFRAPLLSAKNTATINPQGYATTPCIARTFAVVDKLLPFSMMTVTSWEWGPGARIPPELHKTNTPARDPRLKMRKKITILLRIQKV